MPGLTRGYTTCKRQCTACPRELIDTEEDDMAQQSDVQLKPWTVLHTGALAVARREVLGLAAFVRQYPAGCIGAVILVTVTFLALAAPLVTVYDPTQVKLRERKELPSWSHPLGTDYEGRDILTRVIYGGRVSLAVSVLSV